jgi:hypothetical protein
MYAWMAQIATSNKMYLIEIASNAIMALEVFLILTAA